MTLHSLFMIVSEQFVIVSSIAQNLLANKFDFDGATLTEALEKTFANRSHVFTVEQFEQVMAFDGDEAMQKKWKAFWQG